MPCPYCRGQLWRRPRKLAERIRFEAVYRCDPCNRDMAIEWPHMFLLSRHSRCPRCGREDLERLRHRDRIDRMYKNPFSLIQALVGAPIHWCPMCRLQFFDHRPLASERFAKSAASGS